MFGLTSLGLFHTAISLVAIVAGLVLLIRDAEISPRDALGKVYVFTTIVTCVTAFGIFQRGGFGPPHALAIMTLIVLGVAFVARKSRVFGRASRYVETIGYSATYLFHWIPAITETFTRLPQGAPLFASPEDPALQKVFAVLLGLLLIGALLQVRRLRSARRGRATMLA